MDTVDTVCALMLWTTRKLHKLLKLTISVIPLFMIKFPVLSVFSDTMGMRIVKTQGSYQWVFHDVQSSVSYAFFNC